MSDGVEHGRDDLRVKDEGDPLHPTLTARTDQHINLENPIQKCRPCVAVTFFITAAIVVSATARVLLCRHHFGFRRRCLVGLRQNES